MKKVNKFLFFFLILGCSTNSNIENVNSNDSINQISIIQLMDKALSESPTAFINLLSKNCSLITSSNFELTRESDDSIVKKLLPLSNQQLEYFYKSDSLKEIHDYFHFNSFYFGKLKEKDGISFILILNSDFQTSIYLECFLINKKGEITGMFFPSYIELENNYAFYGRGRFINNSKYLMTHISYNDSDDERYTVKDSVISEYIISINGTISQKEIFSQIDTINIE